MLRNVIFIILIALMIIFVLQNIQDVDIQFLFWKLTTPRALMLLLTFGAGLVGGWLLSVPGRQKKSKSQKLR
jgi:uncharacterized integral membrane protein